MKRPPKQAGLGPRAIERNAKRKNLAGSDQARSLHDIFGSDMVQGADLIILAPSSPVLQFLCGFGDRLFADLDVHEELPSGFLSFRGVKFAASYRCNIAQSTGAFIKPGATSVF